MFLESAGRQWMVADWDVCTDVYVAGSVYRVTDEENQQMWAAGQGSHPFSCSL